MGSLSFAAGTTIYVDSPAIIYSIEKHPVYALAMLSLWSAADRGQLCVVTSEFTLAEVLVRPLREGDPGLAAEYRELLGGTTVATVPVSRAVLEQAAALRAAHSTLRTPDAIHAATGLTLGCSAFVTNDKALRQVAGLPVCLIADYVD